MGAYRIVVPIIAPTDAAAASTRATAAAFDIVGSHGLVFWLKRHFWRHKEQRAVQSRLHLDPDGQRHEGFARDRSIVLVLPGHLGSCKEYAAAMCEPNLFKNHKCGSDARWSTSLLSFAERAS